MSRLVIVFSLVVFTGVCIGEPTLVVEPDELIFSAVEGGINPESQSLYISNSSKGKLKWEITEDCDWLIADPVSGEVFGDIDEVAVSIDISGLSAGEYECVLTVSWQKPTGDVEVANVLLTVIVENNILRVPEDYPTIQAAIDAAMNGDTLIVADGTYTGDGNRDIDFLGKSITVQSANGAENCIIDCGGNLNNMHRAFTFISGEDANSILEGFTIINGYADNGGGIYCYESGLTIVNCTFINNKTSYYDHGGGVFCQGGNLKVTNCIFRDNLAHRGGGIHCYRSKSIIEGCIFEDNYATWSGGGISLVDDEIGLVRNSIIRNNFGEHDGGGIYAGEEKVEIHNCEVIGNSAYSSSGYGGGGIQFWYCKSAKIVNSLICNNQSINERGGGIMFIGREGLSLENCTLYGNQANEEGGGIYFVGLTCSLKISNSIMWSNSGIEGDNIYISENGAVIVEYSNVEGGASSFYIGPEAVLSWRDGNIEQNPQLVDPANPDEGNYRLMEGSVCIDAGDPNFVYETGAVDLDGNLRVVDGDNDGTAIVDMGAYEYVSGTGVPVIVCHPKEFVFLVSEGGDNPPEQTFMIYNGGGGELGWEIEENCDWLQVSPQNGNLTESFTEVTLSVNGTGLSKAIYTDTINVICADASNSPFPIEVSLYINDGDMELVVPEEYPTIQSAIDIAEPNGCTVRVIPGVYYENINSRGKNFVLRSNDPNDWEVVEDTIIHGIESNPVVSFSGTEKAYALLTGLTITGEIPSLNGIVGKGTKATISNCMITGNAGSGGGGISDCDGLINNCLISANKSSSGGGAASCDGIISNCFITSNTAEGGEGGGLANCSGLITNCIIAGNIAGEEGGGLRVCNGVISNCTIAGNTAYYYAGGLYVCNGTITNCIIVGNYALDDAQLHGCSVPSYCCIEDWPSGGEGNIDVEPMFVDTSSADPSEWDLHLMWDSLCIDAGDPAFVAEPNEVDLDGNERVVDGDGDGFAIVDMGAYEYQL